MLQLQGVHGKRFAILLAIALTLIAVAARTDEPLARSSDKEVHKQIEAIAERQREFEKALDSRFKRSIVRSASGEVDVASFLKDFSSAVKQMRERFGSKYSASAEATAIFDRATRMHHYMRSHPQLKGANEWDAVAQTLAQLATSYGVTFPLGEGAKPRRIGDAELADAAASFARAAPKTVTAWKKVAKQVPALAADIESGTKDLNAAIEIAKTLRSRVSRGRPSSSEARQLRVLVIRIDELASIAEAPEALSSAWAACDMPLEKILAAFGLTRRPLAG